jgi:hypothetical protein
MYFFFFFGCPCIFVVTWGHVHPCLPSATTVHVQPSQSITTGDPRNYFLTHLLTCSFSSPRIHCRP